MFSGFIGLAIVSFFQQVVISIIIEKINLLYSILCDNHVSFHNKNFCYLPPDGVSVHNGRQTSELVIGKAEPRHAGNYTCVPANAKAASVTVHVVQSKYE